MDVFEKLNQNIEELKEKIEDYEKKLEEKNIDILELNTQLLMVLRAMIGQKIYWAHKNWSKYETHIIKSVEINTIKTSFFGYQYVGKSCICIYVDDGEGYYIADKIGDTLFFDEEEAKLHTRKD